MMTPLRLLAFYQPSTWEYKATPVAVDHMLSIMEGMVKHDLEASRIAVKPESVSVVWENGFNRAHAVEIICFNCGAVMGKATDTDQPDWCKTWWISGLCNPLPSGCTHPLFLTLDESLEYVRHFIWANHNV
jgi:hypothetical protein